MSDDPESHHQRRRSDVPHVGISPTCVRILNAIDVNPAVDEDFRRLKRDYEWVRDKQEEDKARIAARDRARQTAKENFSKFLYGVVSLVIGGLLAVYFPRFFGH